jgi:hypothetical protein
VVMVVPDPGFVARHTAGGLDPSNQAGVGQCSKDVVHRLMGNPAEIIPDNTDDRLRVSVWMTVHRPQNCPARTSHPQARAAQQVRQLRAVGHSDSFCAGHIGSLPHLLEPIKKDGSAFTCSVRPVPLPEELALSENQVSGSIPTTLGSLTKLEQLDLAHNQSSGPVLTSLQNTDPEFFDQSGTAA